MPSIARLPVTLALVALIAGTATFGKPAAAWAGMVVPYPRIETGAHIGRINRIAVDRSERWLVTASDDKTAWVWDLASGNLERILRPRSAPTPKANSTRSPFHPMARGSRWAGSLDATPLTSNRSICSTARAGG